MKKNCSNSSLISTGPKNSCTPQTKLIQSLKNYYLSQASPNVLFFLR